MLNRRPEEVVVVEIEQREVQRMRCDVVSFLIGLRAGNNPTGLGLNVCVSGRTTLSRRNSKQHITKSFQTKTQSNPIL